MNYRVLITFGAFICLTFPKIDIIDIPGFAQGIRYDDLFILLCLILILFRNSYTLNYLPNKSIDIFFYSYLLMFGLISYYTNNLYAIILPLRWIEYLAFYIIISYAELSLKTIRNMIIAYISINALYVILQYNTIVGGIYSDGYRPDVTARISGLTGGSWELPGLLAMFVSASILDNYYKNNKKLLLLIIIVSALMVYQTGTRTGIAVYLVGIAFSLLYKWRLNIFGVATIGIISYLFINQDRINPYIKNTEIPLSMQIRLNAWNEHYIKMDYYNYIFGSGLGSTGLHVDGMFLKIFFDMGIIGLIIFSLYYIKLLYPYKVVGVIILLYCITIDFFTCSKLMYGMYLTIYYIKQQKAYVKYEERHYFNKIEYQINS